MIKQLKSNVNNIKIKDKPEYEGVNPDMISGTETTITVSGNLAGFEILVKKVDERNY